MGLDPDIVEPVAIVGFSAKFPQDATSPEAFWQMLIQGRSAMTEVPQDRFNIDSFYHRDADRLDSLNVRGGHFLQGDLAAFDAPFFAIPHTEAISLDPQQRGLLEGTYKALENAGITIEGSGGSQTGVFVGCFAKEYETLFSRDPELQPKYQASGTGSAMLANRLSWFYDFKGPSITLDTACSSSLNALHLACLSLRTGECTMAIVAGCNIMLNPDTIMMSLSNLNFLSPDSRCYSFDHRANGYSRGEGFGVVVIKLVSNALRDGDTIRAVIRATGSNQDGRTPGITQPSKEAQESLIRSTYSCAGLDLRSTRFFEAHGTGTPIGDPTEAGAIGGVFRDQRTPDEPLLIGAVKSNIGHLEGASGLASLIKTVMVLEKAVIPPNIGFERPHPSIQVNEWSIKFPLGVTPWPALGLRRASVNSFGYGGANAHVVLDDAFHYMRLRNLKGKHRSVEFPPAPQAAASGTCKDRLQYRTIGCYQNGDNQDNSSITSRSKLFLWTSSDQAGLERWATAYRDYLSDLDAHKEINPDKVLEDIAYTLGSKRSMLPWKSYTVADSIEELICKLSGNLSKPCRSSGAAPVLGFVFTGQGAQWYAMGRDLFQYTVYKESMQQADEYLQTLQCPWSLIGELSMAQDSSRIHDPAVSQPVCTALQVALVDLLVSWGIHPAAVVGHSSGEIAAAYCAGGISRNSAWKLAYYRGSLASRLAKSTEQKRGSMMAVALSEETLDPYLARITGKGNITVGCINSPINTTVTGTEDAVNALKEMMDCEQIFARKLPIAVAYHSVQMEEVGAEYRTLIRDLEPPDRSSFTDDTPTMYSSVTGQLISTQQLLDGKYWVANMCSKVRFSHALSQMYSSTNSKHNLDSSGGTKGVNQIVEIGPHSALRRPVTDTLGQIVYNSALQMGLSATATILQLVGELRCHGYLVDLLAANNMSGKANVKMLVDLPAYPFNHSKVYWHESRLSKNFRFRKHPRHELLGTPTADWNHLEAKWRNIIKETENPWIKDHVFNGVELYPAAGMMVMAIEAARQVSTSIADRPIKGYSFLDVSFSKALTLPMSAEGVETQFYLRPQKNQGFSSSQSSEFRLYMNSNNEWTENCRGTIITEYNQDEVEVDHGLEAEKAQQLRRETFARGTRKCKSRVNSKQMYENFEAFGLAFGPTFRSLEQVSYSDHGEAVASIRLHAWKEQISPEKQEVQQHVIHPTALDGVFQLTVAAFTRGGWIPIPTMVPTYIHKLWLSNDFFTQPDLKSIRVYSTSKSKGYREADFDILALNPVTSEPLIIVDSYRATAVTSLDVSSSGGSHWRRLCYSIDWKPDLDLLNREQLSAHCNSSVASTQLHAGELIDEAELVCLYFMSEALGTAPQVKHGELVSHLQKYMDWMRHHCDSHDAQVMMTSPEWRRLTSEPRYREALLSNLEKSGPDGKLYVTIGRGLVGILDGEIDALELLFKEQILQDFYSSSSFVANYQKISAFVDLCAHKNPNQSILEVGAGTGGATGPILEILGPKDPQDDKGSPRFDQYTYTDISPQFFQDAKERFHRHQNRLVFKTLDIEKDPLQQGFEAGVYDVVIASCVLHATTNLDSTLENTRKLLKPGGKLILFEPCNLSCARTSFVFGLLPGWWLGTESHRRWGALLSDEMWHQTLLRNEFSGAEICLRDYDRSRHTFSVIISSASETTSAVPTRPKVIIVIAPKSSFQHEVAQDLQSQLQSITPPSSCEVILVHKTALTNFERAFCIFLPELEDPFLYGIQEENFTNLKHICKASSAILWVTNDGALATRRPELGLVAGYGRCMSSENSNLHFVTLAFEKVSPIPKLVENIVKVVGMTMNKWRENPEQEFVEKDGVLYINRVVEQNRLNDEIFSAVVPQEPELRKIGEDPERALRLTIAFPGLLDTLRFADDTAKGTLGVDEIEVSVRAVGVNFKNVMVALGQLPDSSLGQECAGIVTHVGKAVSSTKIKVGDRVCCVTRDAFKTSARSHVSSVYKMPDGMSFTTAAALPVAFCTAYYALHYTARLREGESVLIHAAAGGVGQAAIQLALLMKAELYVTVGTDQKKQLLMEMYNIPEDRIFYSRNHSFAQGIKRLTNDRGVDVVLNSLAGEALRQSFECVAPLGRFIEIGKKDMYSREYLQMAPFLQGITFASVDLGIVAEQRKQLMAELMEAAMSLATTTAHPPQPLNIFRISEIETAFRSLQSGKNAGKAIIEIQKDDPVMTMPRARPSWYFDDNATYVISGGFGGLGRNIARWMMTRKAKHLVLLSRSGAKGEAALSLLADLAKNGVEVEAPPCDIGNEKDVVSVLTHCAKTLPPIKGCIQGSMVLKDGLFEHMSLENFDAALKPKVQGSWNLHAHLPKGMDFFILLSSTGGIFGGRGQSNYAAGNTYQDALARHRVSLGERCISLNLGLMLEVGFAAERQQVTDSLRAAGYEGIYQIEFLAMLDHYCNPGLPLPASSDSQIIVGIGTPASLSSKGIPEIFWMSRPLFQGLRQMDRAKGDVKEKLNSAIDYKALIESADSLAAAGDLVTRALAKKLSTSLSMPEEDIEVDRPIHAYGVDSLVAVEIRYWLLKEIKAELAVFEILGSKSISQLSVLAARKSEFLQASCIDPAH